MSAATNIPAAISWLFVGQIPKNPLRISITGVDPTVYADISVVMTDPNGDLMDLSAGQVLTDEAASGVIKYQWPTASLFATPGDYRVRVFLDDGDSHEISTAMKIQVYTTEAA